MSQETSSQDTSTGPTPPPPPIGVPETLKTWAGITWRLLIILAGFAVIVQAMAAVDIVLIALFLAAFFTALASPIMAFLQKRVKLPKVVALILSIILILAAIIVVLYVVVNSIIAEYPDLSNSVTQSMSQLQALLTAPPFNLSPDDFNGYVNQFEGWAKDFAIGIGSSALGSIGDVVLGGSVFIFGVIFFMMTPRTIWNWLVGWMPSRSRPYVNTSGEIAWDSLSGYTRGVVIVALCDAILVYIGLIILQVPLAPALAAIVFFGAFIPVIGAPLATFFAAIVALAERGPIIALLCIALTVVVGSFDGDVLQPLVMGKAVSLNPLAIIILIAVGSILLGIIGALVAVPIGSAIYGVMKFLTGRDPEHPLPYADETPPSPPPAAPAPAA